jgi:hypothetical protein
LEQLDEYTARSEPSTLVPWELRGCVHRKVFFCGFLGDTMTGGNAVTIAGENVSSLEILRNPHLDNRDVGYAILWRVRCGPPANDKGSPIGRFACGFTLALHPNEHKEFAPGQNDKRKVEEVIPGFFQPRPAGIFSARLWVGGAEVALMYAAAAVSRTGLLLSSKTGRSASEISLSIDAVIFADGETCGDNTKRLDQAIVARRNAAISLAAKSGKL